MVKRVLVVYGVDVDAVSGWINTCSGDPAGPTDVSRGVFGATVGIDRILKLFNKYGIKGTWFVPGHSVESFTSQLKKVRDTGHEIGLHGYSHEFVATMNEQQQRDIMTKSIDVLTNFLGKRPRGWTAPAWNTSKQSIRVLEEFGIEYDHSFMHHDCQPYYVPNGEEEWQETNSKKEASTWMQPMTKITPSKVVEIPANWHLDDWPPFVVSKAANSHGYVDPDVIEKLWKKQFDYFYREYDTFIFPMTIHPQVSGKPQVILMHENIIDHINSHEGVEWVTMEQIVDEFKEGKIPGTTVEGGA
ncbi:hypothetical protein N7509_013177 [Penicillium cosmopolitanum]|uniref:NodB homology domain-containing protein n=1 Tax=Penicillium cosmopolitanum TaxID=1131564 RepID=A0A9W9SCS0_9EURO|nr:uncharacterized protein N7509_013177 [Penicillium cosmopolitanum]KAJ5376291.1 hypothetical protein N7509_013177 [Penicillium cosmopolitanum]